MVEPAPLDDVGKAALRAEFAKVYGVHKLRGSVQALLVAFFAERGEPVAELGLDVTKDALEDWHDLWRGTLEDAAVTSKRDQAAFLAWGRARCSLVVRSRAEVTDKEDGKGAETAAEGPAERALRIMEGSGVAIPEPVRAKLMRDFKEAEAGDFESQCCNAVTVFILYLGRMPSEDEIRWWNREFKMAGGSSGGKVDITRQEGYVTMHRKTNEGDILTLARALKQETRFSVWVLNTMEALTKAGKTLACVQLTRVLLQADKNSVGVWSVKAGYLHGYFFEEYLGVGLPHVTAMNSALHAVALGTSSLKTLKEKPALSEVGSAGSKTDLYSQLPGSASQAGGSEVGTAMSAMKEMMEEALAPIKEAREASPSGGGKLRALTNSDGECLFCRRAHCTLLKGGEMCRSGKRALGLLRAKETEKSQKDETAAEA